MVTIRNVGGVALFLLGTAFLWITPRFRESGRVHRGDAVGCDAGARPRGHGRVPRRDRRPVPSGRVVGDGRGARRAGRAGRGRGLLGGREPGGRDHPVVDGARPGRRLLRGAAPPPGVAAGAVGGPPRHGRVSDVVVSGGGCDG